MKRSDNLNELTLNNLGFDSEKWKLVQRTCARDSTPDEFEQFMYLCGTYELDPFLKEIFFMKMGGKATLMISRDGYLKIANKSSQFNGMESDAVYEGDKITRCPDGRYILEYGAAHMIFDNSKLVGAYANVFRKDREYCSSSFVSYKDYKKPSPIWNTYPNAMMIKVAEEYALKKAFSVNGIVGQTQVQSEYQDEVVGVSDYITREQAEIINHLLEKCPDPRKIAEAVYSKFNIKKTNQLKIDDFKEVIDYVQSFKVIDISSEGE